MSPQVRSPLSTRCLGAVLQIACEEIVGSLERHVEHWRPHVARDITTGLLKRKVTVPSHIR
jgi:hypothetical protein